MTRAVHGMIARMTDRPIMPAGLQHYRTVGPWDADAIPAGLLAEHRLKAGTWGRIEVLSGAVRFHWDDEAGGSVLLVPGTWDVPPEVPHHLERTGEVRLQIMFWK